MKWLGTLITAVSLVTVAVPAASAAPKATYKTVTIGSCTARGDFAVCDASGTARRHPLIVRVHVTAVSPQHVSGAWTVTCSKGLGAGSKSGQFSGHTPIDRRVKLPYARPDNCIAAADAQLGKGGRLHVWITAYERAR